MLLKNISAPIKSVNIGLPGDRKGLWRWGGKEDQTVRGALWDDSAPILHSDCAASVPQTHTVCFYE